MGAVTGDCGVPEGKRKRLGGAYMRRILKMTALVMTLVLCMAGCGRYTSHYRATAFVHSNTSHSAYMRFSTFDGTMVFTLKSGEGERLRCTGTLESGIAAVYYDAGGTKTELFSVQGGGSKEADLGPLTAGKIYVIVETAGTCGEGDFRFDIEKD